VFSFQVLGASSRRFFFEPALGANVYRTGNAFGYSYSFDHAGRHFGYEVAGEGRTRYYTADVGFTPRTNTNFERLTLRYNSEPQPKARLISWRLSNVATTNFDWQGRSQRWDNQPQLTLNFSRQTFFTAGARAGYERLFEEEFGAKRGGGRPGAFIGADPERSTYTKSLNASAGTTPNEKYSLSLFVQYTWDAFDFDLGAGPRFPRVSPAALGDRRARLDPGPGNALNVDANFTYQPTNAWRTSLNYTKSRLVRHDTGLLAFDQDIYALRSTYQFTRFIFLRARVDYDTLRTNVRGQFLLGWTPSPGTAFYAGYNDDLNRDGFNPFTGQLEPGFRRNGRTFFIKMSYLFRRSF
jgi:hypothetical protein